MTSLLTPGLHRQPLDPVRSAGRLARGDVPVLLGYATGGPVGAAVRISSVRQFEDVFGAPPAHGFLWHAVKGFFETGGRAAYALRVATARARPAQVLLRDAPLTWRATASFPWDMIDPRRLRRIDRTADTAWAEVFERQVLEHGPRSPEPGGRGNALSLDVRRTSRVRSATLPEVVHDGTASRLASLAGLERASVLELSQTGDDGTTRLVTRVPAVVDVDRSLVHWGTPLDALGLDPRRPVRIASVEFDVATFRDGKLEQSFAGLAPHPDHSAAVGRVLVTACRAFDLRPVVRREVDGTWVDADPSAAARALADADWADPSSWPAEGRFRLSGGTDGLEDVSAATWLAALSAVDRLVDAAMVAAPDLVLPSGELPAPASTPAPVADCTDLTPPPSGHLSGTVTGADADGRELPLAGVSVDVAGPGGATTTSAAGTFTLSDVPVGLVVLRLAARGYEPLEFLAQSSPFSSAPPVQISLVRIVAPAPLGPDAVLTVQRAMADPTRVGPYKTAFLDPPSGDSRLDELATWRARLGDDARMAFFVPWLTLPVPEQDGGVLACPPSGHVCGAFAAAEATVGLHRSGANLPLRYVDGTTLALGDDEQAGLNPVGINAVRALPGRGVRLFGTRTLSSDPEWRFLTSRRIVDAIEKTLERALHWMVFEPNTLITRHAVATTAATLLGRLHRDGVLAGVAPEAAFAVKCDLENNPDEGRDAGRLVVDVAVAPSLPYEFVLFRLGHAHDALHVTERPA